MRAQVQEGHRGGARDARLARRASVRLRHGQARRRPRLVRRQLHAARVRGGRAPAGRRRAQRRRDDRVGRAPHPAHGLSAPHRAERTSSG
eukprot:3346610-Prymnesium_polylepis.2